MTPPKFVFKVRYGFKALDFVVVSEGDDLERVIYAWQTGNIVTVKDRMLNGNNILAIEPYYHHYTGWYDNYQPLTGEDWKQIERDCPDFTNVLPYYRERVKYLIGNNRESEIGKNSKLPLIAPASMLDENGHVQIELN